MWYASETVLKAVVGLDDLHLRRQDVVGGALRAVGRGVALAAQAAYDADLISFLDAGEVRHILSLPGADVVPGVITIF